MSPFFWGTGFGTGFDSGFGTSFDSGFGMGGFGMFEVIFTLMFFLVFGVFIFIFIKGIGEWNKNNHSPKLTVDATVVTKRNHTSHHHHDNHVSHSTSYYVTFQVDSGDRMEFHVRSAEYGMLVEGDYGKLSFQGTRYLGFERIY